MKPEIIIEASEYLVANKPAGLIIHPDGKSDELSLVDWVLESYPELRGVGEAWHSKLPLKEYPRAGIMHRLDRDTSGCVLVAKTQEAFKFFKQQFQEHAIEKTYHAFVYGRLSDTAGVIDVPIGRNAQDFRKWSAQQGARGRLREAVTEYAVLKTFEYEHELYSLVELSPKTGRTHQLRVHMKYLHRPIVADNVYAGKLVDQKSNLGFQRQALHARKLVFTDMSGEHVVAEAAYPQDFEMTLDSLA